MHALESINWRALSRRRAIWAAVAVVALIGALLLNPFGPVKRAGAASGSLPAGTGISVSIDSLTDGAVLPLGPVTVSGNAAVDRGVGVPNTSLIYVVDVSSGTRSDGGEFGGECAGDGTIIQCEHNYTGTLNRAAVDGGGVVTVGTVAWADTALIGDVDPGDGEVALTGPTVNGDPIVDGRPTDVDILDVTRSTFTTHEVGHTGGFDLIGGIDQFTRKTTNNTNKSIGVNAINAALQVASQAPQANKIIAFMSEGFFTDKDQIAAAMDAVPPNVHFWTFSIGKNAKCAGVLRMMADRTGGECDTPKNRFGDSNTTTSGDDLLGDLPDVLRDLLASKINGISVSVDGGAPTQITNLPLFRRGPITVPYSLTLNDLTPGRHSICVKVDGKDSGGPGSVTDCRTVTLDTPPVANAGGPYSGLQGAQIPIAGTASDADGPAPRTTWAISAGEGVDPSARCTITDTAKLSTNVSCDRPGTYALTLTADDGAAAPVTAGTTVTIANVKPEVSAGGPYTGTAGLPVNLTGTVVDPDSPNLSVSWTVAPATDPGGGGTETGGTDTGGTASPGPDSGTDGGGTGDGTGTTDGGTTDGGTTDGGTTDGGTTTDAPPTTCSFTDPTALATVVNCAQPGTYTLTLTASDGDNAPVSATTTLTVVPPTVPVGSLSLAAAVAPKTAFVGGDPVVVTFQLRNDGDIPMTGVRLAVNWPRGLPLPGAGVVAPAGAPCQVGGCAIGTLQPGQRVTVKFAVRPNAAADVKVLGTVTTDARDGSAADNAAGVRVVVLQPQLTIDPTTGPQGQVVHANGTNFPPGARIQLGWSTGISQVGVIVVGRDGTFSAPALVYKHDVVQPVRELIATSAGGPRFGEVRSNSFLIAQPGAQPPFDRDNEH